MFRDNLMSPTSRGRWPETYARNYHSTLLTIPEERVFQIHYYICDYFGCRWRYKPLNLRCPLCEMLPRIIKVFIHRSCNVIRKVFMQEHGGLVGDFSCSVMGVPFDRNRLPNFRVAWRVRKVVAPKHWCPFTKIQEFTWRYEHHVPSKLVCLSNWL